MRRILIGFMLCALLLASTAAADEETFFSWTVVLGESGSTTPASMAVAADGGTFIAGHVAGGNDLLGEALGERDAFVLRLDAQGAVQWARRLGGSGEDAFTSVCALPDGGCVALGSTTSSDGNVTGARGGTDAWLVRLDEGGEPLWAKCLGGALDDALTILQVVDETQFFLCGRSRSRNGDLGANNGGWDAWAVLLDAQSAKTVWVYRYGGEGDDTFTAARKTADGWLLLGEVQEHTGTDAEGGPTFTGRPISQMITLEGEPYQEEAVTLGGSGINRLFTIVDASSGWLLAGETNSRSALMPTNYGGQDLWVLQMRPNGTVSWQRTYGGSKDERLHSLTAMPTGGLVALGATDSNDSQVFGAHGGADVWVLSLTASGVRQWQQTIGGSDESTPAGLLVRTDGGLIVAGTTLSQDGDIGRHTSVRTGFLSDLAANGNLRETITVAEGEECTLLQTAASGGTGYVLGSIRGIHSGRRLESIWLGKLAHEDFIDQ